VDFGEAIEGVGTESAERELVPLLNSLTDELLPLKEDEIEDMALPQPNRRG